MIELRPYQMESIQAIITEWETCYRKVLLSLPTGTGKTIVFAYLIAKIVEEGDRVLVLVHRQQLSEQAMDKIKQITELECGLEQGKSSAVSGNRAIVVGSVQSMTKEKRLKQYPSDYFQYIIIDEAHHAVASSYQNILQHFSDAYVLGVTATPFRGDERSLYELFEKTAYEYKLSDAIHDGWLSPINAQVVPLELDITKVKMKNGDYDVRGLATAIDPYLYQIAEEMKTYCKNRKTIVFLPTIDLSVRFCRILNETGFSAAEINGKTKNRHEILHDFESGRYNVLCNSMLLTEGWDCPPVDCVVILRPTNSATLYHQMVGRDTRLYPGKEDLLLLDFIWLTRRHDLCRPANLISEDEKVLQEMNQIIHTSETGANILEIEKQAKNKVQAREENRLRIALEIGNRYSTNLVDLMEFAFGIDSAELMEYSLQEESTPLSKIQIRTLINFDMDPETVFTASAADRLIDILQDRATNGMATPKQVRCLLKYDVDVDISICTKKQAHDIISRIGKNNWKLPWSLRKPEKTIEKAVLPPVRN